MNPQQLSSSLYKYWINKKRIVARKQEIIEIILEIKGEEGERAFRERMAALVRRRASRILLNLKKTTKKIQQN